MNKIGKFGKELVSEINNNLDCIQDLLKIIVEEHNKQVLRLEKELGKHHDSSDFLHEIDERDLYINNEVKPEYIDWFLEKDGIYIYANSRYNSQRIYWDEFDNPSLISKRFEDKANDIIKKEKSVQKSVEEKELKELERLKKKYEG